MYLDIAVLLAPTWLTGLYLLFRRNRRRGRTAEISSRVEGATRTEPPLFVANGPAPSPAVPDGPATNLRAHAAASLGAADPVAPQGRIEPTLSRPVQPAAPAQPAAAPREEGEVFHIDFDDQK